MYQVMYHGVIESVYMSSRTGFTSVLESEHLSLRVVFTFTATTFIKSRKKQGYRHSFVAECRGSLRCI